MLFQPKKKCSLSVERFSGAFYGFAQFDKHS